MNQRELFLRHVAQTSELPLMGVDMNIANAKGVVLTDVNGKKYIDLISGISVSNIGHCHPKVVDAINLQSQKFMHLMVYGEFNQSPQVNYATTLLPHLPPTLNCIYFATGGSESIEGAMKLSKRVTGKTDFVSFKNSYHGSTHGALSLMGDEYFKNAFRPLLPNTKQLTYNSIEELSQIGPNTAAVVLELIQAESGVKPANEVFINEVAKICKHHGALLIVDEIQTGFGRTGTLFAFEQYGITPDVLCIAKGMGGGLPIGAFIADKKIMNSLSHDPVLGHINTFGGNAVCLAAAQANLEVILTERLWESAKKIETILTQHLQHSKIKTLSVKGAMAAVEFDNQAVNFTIIRKCLESGIITDWFLFNDRALRICPPLNINENLLVEALQKIISILNEE
jgi:acetylornithine/succinyldiaminopimelate/putrescine aminotransferase